MVVIITRLMVTGLPNVTKNATLPLVDIAIIQYMDVTHIRKIFISV
jgi:hypothetical protein